MKIVKGHYSRKYSHFIPKNGILSALTNPKHYSMIYYNETRIGRAGRDTHTHRYGYTVFTYTLV